MSKDLEHEGRSLDMELRTDADPERVYTAWADPEKLSQWFTDAARGEAGVGETITWIFEAFGYEIPYQVVAAEPGERFALHFETPDRSGLLEIRIRREGGETVLRLINSGFKEDVDWDEEYEGIRSGWKTALGLLDLYLREHYDHDKQVIMPLQPMDVDWDALRERFATAEGLGSWLTRSGAIAGEGEECDLELLSGRRLGGRVLADTGREIALSWPEVNGALELKGFQMGPQRMAGVRVTLWEPYPEDVAELREEMEQSVARLAGTFS